MGVIMRVLNPTDPNLLLILTNPTGHPLEISEKIPSFQGGFLFKRRANGFQHGMQVTVIKSYEATRGQRNPRSVEASPGFPRPSAPPIFFQTSGAHEKKPYFLKNTGCLIGIPILVQIIIPI